MYPGHVGHVMVIEAGVAGGLDVLFRQFGIPLGFIIEAEVQIGVELPEGELWTGGVALFDCGENVGGLGFSGKEGVYRHQRNAGIVLDGEEVLTGFVEA